MFFLGNYVFHEGTACQEKTEKQSEIEKQKSQAEPMEVCKHVTKH